MKSIHIMILLVLLAGMIIPSGCTDPSGLSQKETHLVTDMLGREIHVPKQVDQVVGLRAGALRLLVYMGASGCIGGIEDLERRPGRPYAMAHPELLEQPVIGPTMGGDAELITAASPDVIFITYSTRSDADELQSRTSIPVVALNCGNFTDKRDTLYQSLRLIGKILHKEERADSLISFFNHQIHLLDSLSGSYPESSRPGVYVGAISYSGARGLVSTEPFYAPFQLVNANNVASRLDNQLISPVTGAAIDIEQLIQWDPEYIFLDAAGLEILKGESSLLSHLENTMTAARKNQVFTLLPFNWYATNFETILVNAWFIGKTIYPDAFHTVDPTEQARIIYQFVLGHDVLDQMCELYGCFSQTSLGL
ncbi:MAG: ABC transporter substrate-binding protein [Bacteroidales bacterium]|nr:ABC transporter substrate-binding protein [Bacteroidales bacterium]